MKISSWSLIWFYTFLVYVSMFAPIVVVVVLRRPALFGLLALSLGSDEGDSGKGLRRVDDFTHLPHHLTERVDVGEQIRVLFEMREKAPGLWDDTWYRTQIGGLLEMTQKDISEEGDKADNSKSRVIAAFTGGDGAIPPV